MAVTRERPYAGFNFLVDLGNGNTEGPEGGFSQVSGLGMAVDMFEYRNGNSRENAPMKLTGLNRAQDVRLQRGAMGSLALYQWLDQIRNGDANALRTVTVQLVNEDRTQTVMTWKLLRARIVEHRVGPLHAQASQVAVEEIVLAFERLEME
jgi:phage tail-like protein